MVDLYISGERLQCGLLSMFNLLIYLTSIHSNPHDLAAFSYMVLFIHPWKANGQTCAH